MKNLTRKIKRAARFAFLLPLTFCLSPSNAQTRVTDTLKSAGSLGQYYNYNNGSVILGPGFTAVPGSGQSFHAYIINTQCIPIALNLSKSQNYLLTTIPRVSGLTDTSMLHGSTCQLMQTVQYIDGLGRPLQTVQVEGSSNGHDVIQPFTYDVYGREVVKYLPYAPTTLNDGSYRSTAITDQHNFYSIPPPAVTVNAYPFDSTRIEASPLNRPLEQGAPGAAWQLSTSDVSGSGHTVRLGYGVNVAGVVPLWNVIGSGAAWGSTYYAAGTLYADTTTDENGHITISYTDLQKHIIAKRIQNSSAWLMTCYVYDNLDNLTYVVPPIPSGTTYPTTFTESDPVFSNFIYGYRYDGRRRVIKKKIPGKGWEYILYNTADQLVATQDSVEKINSQWIFTKYDGQQRVVETGILSSSASQVSLQTTLDGITTNLWETANGGLGNGYSNVAWPTSGTSALTFNYYDSYVNVPSLPGAYSAPTAASTMTTGLLMATLTNVLGSSDMLWNVHYYDDKARVIKSYAQHYLDGSSNLSVNNYDAITSTYTFTDKDTTTTRQHYVNSGGTASLSVTIANRYTYDHVGRKQQTWEQINSGANVLLSQTDYNEVGQAMTKHLNSTNSGASFSQNISYAYNERGWLTQSNTPLFSMQLKYNDGTIPQYNGNISNQYWSSSSSSGNYIYKYDLLNRLLSGIASTGNTEKSIVYDEMGNIKGLQRYLAGTVIDALKYDYTLSGNQTTQLQTITDSTTNDIGLKHGTFTYTYDGNGNMVTDNSKGLVITYNILNLPNVNTLTGGTISYVYDAYGNKLRKLNTVGTVVTTDYISGIQYVNGVIDFIQTEEGRALNVSGAYNYQYNLTDNLGDARLMFGANAAILQQDNYLPFGFDVNVNFTNPKNNYLYNKKELQVELGQYDYGARLYDPVIAKWTTIDPKSELNRRWALYSYGFNNPIRMIDPDGMMTMDNNTGTITIEDPDEIAEYIHAQAPHAQSDDSQKKEGDSQSNGTTKKPLPQITIPHIVGHKVINGQFYNLFSNGQLRLWKSGNAEPDYTFETIASFFLGFGEATESAEEVGHYVYLAKNEEEQVIYVGITNNFARREAEQLAQKGINIEKLLGNLSKPDARSVEQVLIEMYKLPKNGGQLLNKINSIAKTNPVYSESLKRGYDLLKNIGYLPK